MVGNHAVVVVQLEGIATKQSAKGAALSERQPEPQFVEGTDAAVPLLEG